MPLFHKGWVSPEQLGSLPAWSSWLPLSDHHTDLLLLCCCWWVRPFFLADTTSWPWLFHTVTHRLRLLYHFPTGTCSNPHVERDNCPGRSSNHRSVPLGDLTKISHHSQFSPYMTSISAKHFQSTQSVPLRPLWSFTVHYSHFYLFCFHQQCFEISGSQASLTKCTVLQLCCHPFLYSICISWLWHLYTVCVTLVQQKNAPKGMCCH